MGGREGGYAGKVREGGRRGGISNHRAVIHIYYNIQCILYMYEGFIRSVCTRMLI